VNLLDFIPSISGEFAPPRHLLPWVKMFERVSEGETVRAMCSLPIRHYKSETTMHGIVWLLTKDPTLRVMLLTHSHERAVDMGKRLRQIARMTNVGPSRGTDTIDEWRNEQGGGVTIMSAEQSKLGKDVHVLVFDDPLDEHGALDPKVREAVDHTIVHYTSRCMRKGKPGSVLGVMSRWHPDDPVGRRLSRSATSWEYFHQAAVVDEGTPIERAFAPEVWSLEELKKVRAELAEVDPTERLWWAQFQNMPRADGGDLFKVPARYETLPDHPGFRDFIGIDLAYSTAKVADWFAIAICRAWGKTVFVREVLRDKLDPRGALNHIRAAYDTYGEMPVYSYMAGPEKGSADYLTERGIKMIRMPARFNKRVRAQRTIDRWNAGDVLIPANASWVTGFLKRVSVFRGAESDGDDDEIDALVSACDGALGSNISAGTKTFGKRRL
jgi:hypothetical protein